MSGIRPATVTQRRAVQLWLRLKGPARRELIRLGYRRERARAGALPTYPNRVMFIAGLPKGGTNWIAQLLEEVPGYRQRPIRDRDRCMRQHDICDGVIESLPRDLYSILRTHTRWSPENLGVLERQRLKTVVLHRDLRDQVVSRVYHVLNDPRHHRHQDYRAMAMEDALTDSIDVVIEHYVPWVGDWLDQIERDPEHFYELRYEELHADPARALGGVLEFYDIPATTSRTAEIVDQVRARTTFGLSDGRLLTGAGTARRGAVGDWRRHFTPEHVRRFKLGAGEFLIRVGYEQDMEWTAAPTTASPGKV